MANSRGRWAVSASMTEPLRVVGLGGGHNLRSRRAMRTGLLRVVTPDGAVAHGIGVA